MQLPIQTSWTQRSVLVGRRCELTTPPSYFILHSVLDGLILSHSEALEKALSNEFDVNAVSPRYKTNCKVRLSLLFISVHQYAF